jgi:hypothetical protein
MPQRNTKGANDLAKTSVPFVHFWGFKAFSTCTTISPYLFFWQAAEEVEDERAHGRIISERTLMRQS